jgi:hypothetical protein
VQARARNRDRLHAAPADQTRRRSSDR